jgi:hypothetical protein
MINILLILMIASVVVYAVMAGLYIIKIAYYIINIVIGKTCTLHPGDVVMYGSVTGVVEYVGSRGINVLTRSGLLRNIPRNRLIKL